MTRWIDWKKSTKRLYEQKYQELLNLNAVSAAQELSKYIEDVDNELAEACQKQLELASIDYNISDIIQEQKEYKKKYRKKLKEIKYD